MFVSGDFQVGLFDFFKAKSGEPAKKGGSASKWADRAADKRAQTYERTEALQALADLGTADAAEALLRRFTFAIDPSISDQEEKELAFRGILNAGRDAIDSIRAFAAKADSLAWPMKLLRSMLNEDEYVTELLEWLSRWDTEYAKFIDPKLQLLGAFEEHKDPRIVDRVAPFLEDVSEQSRFTAASALLAQGDPRVAELLMPLLLDDESVRIRARIADGFMKARWQVPEDARDRLALTLPSLYRVSASGTVER